jgi:hypothetical protein
MKSQIRDSVLNAIADDYEDVGLNLEAVHNFDDPTATTEQVSAALAKLVKDGLAQAYELSPKAPCSTAVDFDLSRMEELWFHVTPKGKNLVRADASGN